MPRLFVTWPHQVSIGKNCNLEHGIYFKYDGIRSKGPSIIIDDMFLLGPFVSLILTVGLKSEDVPI